MEARYSLYFFVDRKIDTASESLLASCETRLATEEERKCIEAVHNNLRELVVGAQLRPRKDVSRSKS